MATSNAADLNAFAAAAEDFDELYFYTDDPGDDYTENQSAGPFAISMGAAGAAGPSSSSQPATDGRTYATEPADAVLAEMCTHAGVRVSATGRFRSFRLARGPMGPGTFPVVYGLAVTNRA